MGIILYDLISDKYHEFPESMTKPNDKTWNQNVACIYKILVSVTTINHASKSIWYPVTTLENQQEMGNKSTFTLKNDVFYLRIPIPPTFSTYVAKQRNQPHEISVYTNLDVIEC